VSASFEEAIARPDEEINLAEAALWIARDVYPDLRIDRYLDHLDEWAADIIDAPPDRSGRPWSPGERDAVLWLINDYLFRKLGFHGNREDYYHPENSYLNNVLDKRTGIPITLSIIYLEIGWRLGLPLAGIGIPGHFVVGWMEDERVFLDPFNAGEVLRVPACQERIDEIYGHHMPLRREWLEPISRRYILVRLLNNLKGVYLRQNQIDRAVQIVEKILVLEPEDLEEVRDLGLLQAHQGRLWAALAHLERYLSTSPGASDGEQVRQIADTLFARIAEEG